uniref:F-box domain-containing protein n=1 Tax=Rhizophora mucronata TaxID=61149 RepID=A0A2P2KYH3_RHIMU
MPQSLDCLLFLGIGFGSSSVPLAEVAAEPEVPKEREEATDIGTFFRKCGIEPPVEEKRKRWRSKRKKGNEGQVGGDGGGGGVLLQDPLEVLGRDLMMKIFSNVDARSVALSLVVSRSWHGVACSDSLWSLKCEELWVGKAHIPRFAQAPGISKLAAYSFSVMDGKRNRIMRDDLCDHVWEFHFTKAAPEYWRNLDPYWKGTSPLMHRYFHPDGSLTADPGDRVWGGHECCYSIVTSFIGDGKIRKHYVRVNRWPQMTIRRKEDWSWEMSNCIYCYSSVPDAHKEGRTGPLVFVM